jgi:predicted chitinase/LysM repeat protein
LKGKIMARKQGNPPTSHTVEAGDTLFDIAQAYYGDGNQWLKISAANGNIQPQSLQVGQQLQIPAVGSPAPQNGNVVVYNDSQYRGASQALGIGRYDWGQILNDTISSLKVPAGMKVTLYSDTRFGGKSKTFTSDTPYVGDDFNDRTSSIIIEAGDPSIGIGFAGIVSRQTFEAMFPNRDPFYSYDGLVAATQKYSSFCNEGSDEQRRREAAAFLANIAHETGDLRHIEEENKANWSHYCQPGIYPCTPGKTYHGRGPIQLSWNYNYGACGAALGIDLLNNPDLVARDSAISFMTALWFWMTPQPPKPSCHHAISTSGFGMTINIINGGIECGKGQVTPQAQSRIQRYERYTRQFGVTPGGNLSC